MNSADWQRRSISTCKWLSDLDSFKSALCKQGAEPKVLEYVNEAFGRLAERIRQIAG
ncbi:hypothetical protein [Verminephrobacter aporrectodeae]|uniref:hypothetical protein n=1 Tax=Verminephrobacter aporrectodeae TaxID=1110389 RepID=UPI00030A7A1E